MKAKIKLRKIIHPSNIDWNDPQQLVGKTLISRRMSDNKLMSAYLVTSVVHGEFNAPKLMIKSLVTSITSGSIYLSMLRQYVIAGYVDISDTIMWYVTE